MQPLNIQDRVMVALHQSLRRRGYAGLLLQSHLHLGGRLHEKTLQTALDRLARCQPVVGARLVPASWFGSPRWEGPEPAGCPLTVADLDTDGDDAVASYAERLFATPLDLRSSPLVAFHLLRRPGGRDVVLLQWAHALMDGKGGELLLQEVNRLHADPSASGTVPPPGDLLLQQLASRPWRQRLRAYLTIIRDLPLLGFPAQLLGPRLDRASTTTPRITLRRLDAVQSAACLARVHRLCGFANVMPVLLAAAYRAASRVAPRPPGRWSVFYIHAPINYRDPGSGQAIFNNLQSYIRLQARTAQLGDGDELARQLHRQFRAQLRGGFDLGFLRGVRFLSGRPRLTSFLLKMLCGSLTFVFGYHGSVGPGLETFCDVPVEHLYTGLPNAWSPPGLSFAAHQFQGRFYLMVSSIAERIPEAVANAFLDEVVAELLPD